MAGRARDSIIYVLEDDAGVREGLGRLLRSEGVEVRGCASIDELLDQAEPERTGCVLFDLSVTRSKPRPLRDCLAARGIDFPLIALTGSDGCAAATNARAAGASLLFRKPVDARALLDAVNWFLASALDTPTK